MMGFSQLQGMCHIVEMHGDASQAELVCDVL